MGASPYGQRWEYAAAHIVGTSLFADYMIPGSMISLPNHLGIANNITSPLNITREAPLLPSSVDASYRTSWLRPRPRLVCGRD